MTKFVVLVRHCAATGQAADAELTELGSQQAKELSRFLENFRLDRIISSPFVRAQASIQPFATARSLEVEIDDRLAERVLSGVNLEDWLSKLEATYQDMDLKFEGGESSREAMSRASEVVDELEESTHTVLVTHGNLMSLLLKSFDDRFGFEAWQGLTNPDVYVVRIENEVIVKRVWED